MEIIEVDFNEYGRVINNPYHIYNQAAFAELNSGKVSEIFYLLFFDGKFRFGLTAGIKDNSLLSPFSAPFGGLNFLRDEVKINNIDKAFESLVGWSQKRNVENIDIKLPPLIYNNSFISKQINSLFRNGFLITNIEVNHHFNTDFFDESYIEKIWYNARKNLKISLKNELIFAKCCSIDEKQKAYEIIKTNRDARGFPLRMTWDQIYQTSKIIEADFFICWDRLHNPIGSAIVFHVAESIVQIIYWGDIPEYYNLKTMNFLSFKVFEYYKKMGMSIIDIGPSSEYSMPNFGLCEFKESIGNLTTNKFQFKKNI